MEQNSLGQLWPSEPKPAARQFSAEHRLLSQTRESPKEICKPWGRNTQQLSAGCISQRMQKFGSFKSCTSFTEPRANLREGSGRSEDARSAAATPREPGLEHHSRMRGIPSTTLHTPHASFLEGSIFVTPFERDRIRLRSKMLLLYFGSYSATITPTPHLRDKPWEIVLVLQKFRQTLLSSLFFIYCVP